MHRNTLASLLSALVLTAGAGAQRTWIIDANRGPGYDFQLIQQGVDAARAGDILLVRAGPYMPFRVSKGLRILGLPGVLIQSTYRGPVPIEVGDLPAGQTLVMAGLTTFVIPFMTTLRQILLRNCAGPVVLEGVHCSGASRNSSTLGLHSIHAVDCKAVTLNACLVGFGLFAERTTITAADSVFRRYDGYTVPGPLPAIELRSSTATLAGCIAVGETAWSPRRAMPALQALASRVSIRGRGTYLAGVIPSASSPAVLGDSASTLEVDPRVVVQGSGGAQAITGFGSVVSQPLPALSARGGLLGATIDIEMLGTHRHVFALSASAPAVPLAIPPFGSLWLDPGFRIHLVAGLHDASGVTTLRMPVPSATSLRGLSLAWQTVGGPWPALVYSNAVVTTLR